MAHPASIPQASERDVLRLWRKGIGPVAIADWLLRNRQVKTTPASVTRCLERIAAGRHTDALAATIATMRLQGPGHAADLAAQLYMLNFAAGTSAAGTGGQSDSVPEHQVRRVLAANRSTLRVLRLIGVGTKDGTAALEAWDRKMAPEAIEVDESVMTEDDYEPIQRAAPAAPGRPPENQRFDEPGAAMGAAEEPLPSTGAGAAVPPGSQGGKNQRFGGTGAAMGAAEEPLPGSGERAGLGTPPPADGPGDRARRDGSERIGRAA